MAAIGGAQQGIVSTILQVTDVLLLRMDKNQENLLTTIGQHNQELLTQLREIFSRPVPNALGRLSDAEMFVLIDWLVNTTYSLFHRVGQSEKRRLLRIAYKVLAKVSVRVAEFVGQTRKDAREQEWAARTLPFSFAREYPIARALGMADQLEQLARGLKSFYAAVYYVIPDPEDDDQDMKEYGDLRRERVEIFNQWEKVQEDLFESREAKSEFETIRADGTRLWPLLGFANSGAFEDYVSPSLTTLLRESPPLLRELFTFLAKGRQASIADLRRRGFPEVYIAEAANCLVRELCIDIEAMPKKIVFTAVGLNMLRRMLKQVD